MGQRAGGFAPGGGAAGPRPSYYKKKFFFSIRDRILLHLEAWVGYEEEVEVTDALTQFGIAGTVKAGRSTCSKLLQSMEAEGLIQGRRAHIPGAAIRRTVYFLTPRGVGEAEEVRRRVTGTTVTVRFRGGARKLRVEDIPRALPIYCELVDVATRVSRGVFDVEAFLRSRLGGTRGLAEALYAMPRFRRFVGRKAILAHVERWVARGDTTGLLLVGPPGIGKTAIAARLVQGLRGSVPILWCRLHAGSSIREVARRLGSFLARMDRKEMQLYAEGSPVLSREDIMGLAVLALSGQKALLVFDGLTQAPQETQQFIGSLTLSLEAAQGPRVVVTTRSLPEWGAGLKRVEVLAVAGLNLVEASRLLALRNVPESIHPRLHRATRGNPLLLELVQGGEDKVGDVRGYLERKVIPRLMRGEREVLALAATHREPMAAAALASLERDALLPSLVDQGLLRALLPNLHEPHDLLREAVLGSTPPRAARELHAEASRFLIAQERPRDLVEALYHLVSKGDIAQAINIAMGREEELVRAGLSEDLELVVDQILIEKPRMELRMEAHLLKGRLLLLRDRSQEAGTSFETAASIAQRSGLEGPRVEALEGSGRAALALGRPAQAYPPLEAALHASGEGPSGNAPARLHYLLGVCALAEANASGAVGRFRAAMRSAPEAVDARLSIDILLQFGLAYGLKGNASKAISYKLRALRLAQSVQDTGRAVRVQLALARDYWDLGDEGRALREASGAAETVRQLGDPAAILEAGVLKGLLGVATGDAPKEGDLTELRALAVATGRHAAAAQVDALVSLGALTGLRETPEGLVAALEQIESPEGARWWVAFDQVVERSDPSTSRDILLRAHQDSKGVGGLLAKRLDGLMRHPDRRGGGLGVAQNNGQAPREV